MLGTREQHAACKVRSQHAEGLKQVDLHHMQHGLDVVSCAKHPVDAW